MNVHDQRASIRTADDFLRWNEGREGKREFVDGRIVEMMVGVTRSHARLAMGLSVSLLTAVRAKGLTVASADFGVRTPAGIRYPDVVVDGLVGVSRDLAALEPILVAEILSPSSIAIDFGPKAAEYTAIASLRHYLVLSQDEPRVWLWDRGKEGFGPPEMIEGVEASVALSAFGMTLSLADLYRGIA